FIHSFEENLSPCSIIALMIACSVPSFFATMASHFFEVLTFDITLINYYPPIYVFPNMPPKFFLLLTLQIPLSRILPILEMKTHSHLYSIGSPQGISHR
ncbi:MAG TPA: hypothetical protein VGE79_11505, partial [Niastella sp.]